MNARLLLALCFAACLVSCHARIAGQNGEKDGYAKGYKKYQEGPPGKQYTEGYEHYKKYSAESYPDDEHKHYTDVYEPHYEEGSYVPNYEASYDAPYGGPHDQKAYNDYTEGPYESYGKEEYDSYEGYGDYGYGGVPCTDPNKWPAEWYHHVCINPYSGIRNKHNMTDCHETANEICKVWPGTTQTCTYKYSGKDKVCREPHGACDVKEYCTGYSALCPLDEYKPAHYPCRKARGPCEKDAECKGDHPECPDSYTPHIVCNDEVSGICDEEDKCVDGDYKCPQQFKPSTHKCGTANPSLPCDADDYCSGNSDKCIDKVKDKGHVCNSGEAAACILGGKCDGTEKTCPPLYHAPTGTPCNKDGLWDEVYDHVKGEVAVKGTYTKEEVAYHGWAECDRCYGGECQTFKWEYWNTPDGGHYSENHKSYESHDDDHKESHGGKTHGKEYNSKSHDGGHKSTSHKGDSHSSKEGHKGAKIAEATSEFYPTRLFDNYDLTPQAAVQSGDKSHVIYAHKKGKNSYVPEVYCHNPYKPKDA